ncbi:MAG: benzoylformate decarboxylase [Betaproteobacteria bacterium RIFCSPLOWO2_02_FULL_65_24]|nr:MAG: benzoylformate decarboxylase [Betaproteobacteria bacterium RIFCSPLOWO2_02_FULL_65_24]
MARMSGADALLRLLVDEGVTHLFGNPGTTELPLMAALAQCPELTYVLGLQEAVVVAMAEAYGRASGRLTAANVHVTPGLGNAMGALYAAHFAGAPLLVTAGQQDQGHGLLEPILAGDLVQMARPYTKWAVEATRAVDLPRIVRRAAKVALAPPAGPVFISLPADVLRAQAHIELGRRVRVEASNRPSADTLGQLATMLLAAQRPVMVVGQEVSTRDAFAEAASVAQLLGAAVYQQTMPTTAQFVSEHPAHMGPLGRNQKRVRATLEPYDVLFCVGADLLRMSLASEIEPLPETIRVVHLTERTWELGKNYRTDLAIQADVRETLRELIPLLQARAERGHAQRAASRLTALEPRNWASRRAQAAEQAAKAAETKPIDPRFFALKFAQALPRDAVVVEEAATTMEALLGFVAMRDRSSYFGLASGALGFGLAWAVGVSLALPGRPVAAVIGDGSAMYALPALWTAAHCRVPVTFVIVNNRSYRVLKERMPPGAAYTGMDLRDPAIDFVALAQSVGLNARRVTEPRDIEETLHAGFSSGAPNLVEVQVDDGFGNR